MWNFFSNYIKLLVCVCNIKKLNNIENCFLLLLTIFIRLKYELEILKKENNEFKLKNIDLTNAVISQKNWSGQEKGRFECHFTKICHIYSLRLK